MGGLLKDGSCVRHMFYTIFVLLTVGKIHVEHLRSSSFTFLKVNSQLPGKFTERLYSYFTSNFSNRYFSELQFLTPDRKINRIYQQLKPGDI